MPKHTQTLIVAGIAILIAAASYFLYPRPQLAVLVTPTEQPTSTPIDSPLPTQTPALTPTASPKPTPVLTTRLGYVQEQLLAAGFDASRVTQLVNDARRKLYPVKQVAYKEPNWPLIEQKMYAPAFVQKGKDYIQAHQAVFDSAEQHYGVPKEVLAGIIAIETEFGANSGTTITFNALYSRMEQWPAGAWKAQASQLIALATYCLQSNHDCFAIKGSYAGAIGIVQFMPYSLLIYGVDGDNDGSIDLYKPADAIPSAANFLIQHHWQDNQLKALAGYYGSSAGYPAIVLKYASLLAQ